MASTLKSYDRRRAINFDLNIEALKENYSVTNPKGAYKEIRSFFEENGFFHRQGSGYCSEEKLSDMELLRITEKLFKTFPWLDSCSKRIDATDIGNVYDLKAIHKESGLKMKTKFRYLPDRSQFVSGKSILQQIKSNKEIIAQREQSKQNNVKQREEER